MPSASSSRLTSPERRDLTHLGMALATGLFVLALAPLWVGGFLAVAAFILVSISN